MKTYRELYLELFRSLRDAVELMEQGDILSAMEKLIAAQQTGEEAHLEADILADQ